MPGQQLTTGQTQSQFIVCTVDMQPELTCNSRPLARGKPLTTRNSSQNQSDRIVPSCTAMQMYMASK